jgi:hypothetical protein
VDGVWEAGRVVDYEADGGAGAKVVDVPLEQVSMGRSRQGIVRLTSGSNG